MKNLKTGSGLWKNFFWLRTIKANVHGKFVDRDVIESRNKLEKVTGLIIYKDKKVKVVLYCYVKVIDKIQT